MKKLYLPPTRKYSVDKLRFSIDINGMIKDAYIPSGYKYTILDGFRSLCKEESSNGVWRKAKVFFKREFHNFACWVKVPVRAALQGDEILYAKVKVFIHGSQSIG